MLCVEVHVPGVDNGVEPDALTSQHRTMMSASKKVRWSGLLIALLGTMLAAPPVLLGTPPASAATMFSVFTLNETMNPPDNGSQTKTITVTGVKGAVTFMEIALDNFNHTHPADIDIKLTGPNGQSVILMSDTPSGPPGCSTEAKHAHLRFAGNGNFLPITQTLVSGYYAPSNYGDAHDCGTGGSDLSATEDSLGEAFYGINPNGVWTLEMADDGPGDTGYIYDWRLFFETAIRATSTAVVCAPDPGVVGAASTCTATVTDIEGAGVSSTPRGTVTFSKVGVAGTFSRSVCTIRSSGSCSVAMTPSAAGRATVIGTYAGSLNHRASKDDDSFTAGVERRSSATTVLCTPSTVIVGSVSTCTVKVADTASGTKATPAGTANVTKTGGAGALSAASCKLTAGKCTVTFKPSVAGMTTIKGTYQTKGLYSASTDTAIVTGRVPRRLTLTSVQCTPNAVNVGADSTCTATITDIGAGTKKATTGTVTFAKAGSSGPGAFSPTSCTLASGRCTVKYRPTGGGATTVKGSYGGSAVHAPSYGSASVTGRPRTTATTVTCAPRVVMPGGSSTCTVGVTDTAIGTLATPTGTVDLAATGGPGALSATSCTLASQQCTVTYTPSGDGLTTVSGTFVATAIHSASTGTGIVDHRPQ